MTGPDFLDSFAPYDAEVCTNEAWKLPEGQSLAGKFDGLRSAAREGFWTGLNPLASWRLVRGWLFGGPSV